MVWRYKETAMTRSALVKILTAPALARRAKAIANLKKLGGAK